MLQIVATAQELDSMELLAIIQFVQCLVYMELVQLLIHVIVEQQDTLDNTANYPFVPKDVQTLLFVNDLEFAIAPMHLDGLDLIVTHLYVTMLVKMEEFALVPIIASVPELDMLVQYVL